MTNYEKIKGMDVDEMAEDRIDRIDIYTRSSDRQWIGDFRGIAKSREEALWMEKGWLEGGDDQ